MHELKHSFEYYNQAKASMQPETSGPEEDFRLFQAYLQGRASQLDEGLQRSLHEIQGQKNTLMAELREDLARIDHDEPFPPERIKGSLPIVANSETGQLFTQKYGDLIEVTPENILTDGEWGLSYYLDVSAPRLLRKEYVVAEARRRISNLYDEQILIARSQRSDKYKSTQTYKTISSTTNREERPGILFEKMYANTLLSIIRETGLPMSIEHVPIRLDVENGIDFIVSLDLPEDPKDPKTTMQRKRIGVQVSINPDKEVMRTKSIRSYGLDKDEGTMSKLGLDHACFVYIKDPGCREKYLRWQQYGSYPGGPEAYLTVSQRLGFLYYTLEQIRRRNPEWTQTMEDYFAHAKSILKAKEREELERSQAA